VRTAGWRVDDEDPGAEHHPVEHYKGGDPGGCGRAVPRAGRLDCEDAPTGREGADRSPNALAPHLPETERGAVLSEALDAARPVDDPDYRAEALGALAPHLPEGLLSEALDAARPVDDPDYRAGALVALAPHLPETERGAVLSAALDSLGLPRVKSVLTGASQ